MPREKSSLKFYYSVAEGKESNTRQHYTEYYGVLKGKGRKYDGNYVTMYCKGKKCRYCVVKITSVLCCKGKECTLCSDVLQSKQIHKSSINSAFQEG